MTWEFMQRVHERERERERERESDRQTDRVCVVAVAIMGICIVRAVTFI